jgi:hypothetical protein
MRFGQESGAPPQGYLWPDGYYYTVPPPEPEQPTPYYAQPGWWADTLIRQALAPVQAPAPVVVVQEEPASWLAWAIGAAGVIAVIRALR